MFREVLLCHPGYDQGLAHFLSLFVSDSDSCDPPRRGVLHQVALDACRILANNEDGFLSGTRDRSGRIPIATAVLCEQIYWYFPYNMNLEEQYPIVTDFRAWRFPQQLPDHWAAARLSASFYTTGLLQAPTDMSASVKDSDQCCVISGASV